MLEQNNPKINKASNLNQIMENLWQKMDMDKKIPKAVKPHQPLPQEKKRRIVVLNKFSPRPFAKELNEQYHFFTDKNENLYVFNPKTGLWMPQADTFVKAILRQKLVGEEQAKTYYLKEIIEDLKGLTFKFDKPELPEPALELIPFNNLVFNLKTDDVLKFRPEFYFTTKLAVDYNPSAKCPRIDKIFSEIVKDPTDLYELVGYCFFRCYTYQKVFFLYGSGGNGKSLFLNILKNILGNGNVISTSLTSLQQDRFSSAELHKKMAAIAEESPYNVLKNTELIKKLTGGDLIKGEQKWRHPFYFVNYAKLIFSANELPRTDDKTVAFYRRLFLIEFPNVISGTELENKALIHTLRKEEFEGLAFKCLEYLKLFIKRGYYFSNDKPTEELRQQYETLTNPLKIFLKEFTEEDSDGFIPKQIFKEAFSLWCKTKGFREWNDGMLGKEMKYLYQDQQKKLDEVEANEHVHTLHRLHTLFLFSPYIHKKKNMKYPVYPVHPVHGPVRWRVWRGLKWKENKMDINGEVI